MNQIGGEVFGRDYTETTNNWQVLHADRELHWTVHRMNLQLERIERENGPELMGAKSVST